MRRLCVISVLLFGCVAAAEETEPTRTFDLREIVEEQKPRLTAIERKMSKPKKTQPPVVKGRSYLLTYEADDGEWYEDEVIASGRYATYCDGVRYEVYNDDLKYFALPKELKRIYDQR